MNLNRNLCLLLILGGTLYHAIAGAAPPEAAPTPPTLRLSTYDTVEILPDLPTDYDNPFDPEQITVTGIFTSPKGKAFRTPGFFGQEFTSALRDGKEVLTSNGEPGWKVRFSPNVPGEWTYKVYAKDKDGLKLLNGDFIVRPGKEKGFIRRSQKSRFHLQYDDGTPYFLIGENVGWAGSRGTHDYEDWYSALGRAGGNWARVWLVHWNMGLEWTPDPSGGNERGTYRGLGRYALDNAWRIDRMLELAKKNGIAVMLTFGTYGDLKDDAGFFNEQNWERNPYNAKNGGPAKTPADFFSNPAARALYKQKLRYLVARYGHNTAVQSWEFWNEANAPADWVAEMSQYLRDLDPYDHLISTTYGNEEIWKIPQIDFTQTHFYGDTGSITDMAGVVTSQNVEHTQKYGKPHLVAEFGIDWRKTDREYDPKGLGISLHNGLWSSAMSRGMGGAAIWWWDNYVHPLNLYREFTPLARFARRIPWSRVEWKLLEADPPRLPAATKTYTDLVVPARFGWGKPPGDAAYTLRPNGQVEGGDAPQYLYSAGKPDLRTTPRFRIRSERPGRFTVHVQDVMSGGTLRIRVDGKTALEQPLPAGPGEGPWKSTSHQPQYNTYLATYDRSYGVDVPAGEHVIEVENATGDWIRVSEYRMTNYRSSEFPAIRLLGMHGGKRAVIWVQDERSNWKEAQAGAEPRLWKGVQLRLKGMTPGAYRVFWWDTRKGVSLTSTLVRATKEGLTFTVPEFRRDIAAEIR
ncbi:MAG: DUF5060 domain-containing protein [Armatimonadetes bacterium]|nr:DUF5060 domain-containing protein [Armatimonadota bacterium]